MAEPLRPEAQFQGFLAQGRFMIQRVISTGEHVFFPRIAQPGTGQTDLEWVEASGSGTIYSFTIVCNKSPEPSYVVALVDLTEGARMMSRIVDCEPDAVRIGMFVAAHVGEVDGAPAVLFSPADEIAP
jgi:uncharacterized OB-fold protein